MKRKVTVTLNEVTEADIRNAFHDAFDQMGIAGGQQIPGNLCDVREILCRVLFKPEFGLREIDNDE